MCVYVCNVKFHKPGPVCISESLMFLTADKSSVYCDFESDCSVMMQDQEDDEEWFRLSASNLSGVRDHTFFSGIYSSHAVN